MARSRQNLCLRIVLEEIIDDSCCRFSQHLVFSLRAARNDHINFAENFLIVPALRDDEDNCAFMLGKAPFVCSSEYATSRSRDRNGVETDSFC